MSFLNVKIPVVTIDSLIDDIRTQVKSGRLNISGEEIRNTTPELDRLCEMLRIEFNVRWKFILFLFLLFLSLFQSKEVLH